MKKIMILTTLVLSIAGVSIAQADDQWQGQANQSNHGDQRVDNRGNPQLQGQRTDDHGDNHGNPQWQGQRTDDHGDNHGNPQWQGQRTDDHGDNHGNTQWQGQHGDDHGDNHGNPQWQGNRGDDHGNSQHDRHNGDHGDNQWQGQRFHAPNEYSRPRGYQERSWQGGDRLPSSYRRHQYYVDYRQYHLDPPPRGHRWIRVDNDVVLAVVATGVISTVIQGLYY